MDYSLSRSEIIEMLALSLRNLTICTIQSVSAKAAKAPFLNCFGKFWKNIVSKCNKF